MSSYKLDEALYIDQSTTPRGKLRASPLDRLSHLSLLLMACALSTSLLGLPSGVSYYLRWGSKPTYDPVTLQRWEQSWDKCERLHVLPGPPSDFKDRKESDRFVKGTKPTLIRNATVWTGNDNGKELLRSTDVLLDRGLVVKIGKELSASDGAEIVQAHGAWLTPGIFDMHSHISVDALPNLSASDDTNSVAGPVLPWLRSLDAMNTHDLAFKRTVSGGVTTSLILPGSANSIGGQAFPIKLRPTKEKTPESRAIELPYNIAGNKAEWRQGEPPRWRHMKMACGENIRRFYKQTRLDLAWNFRSAFEKARKLKEEQDIYCAKAVVAKKTSKVMEESFPDDLQWEALVDVLRGKVKVNTHCYEVTDLAAFVRFTHEFKFSLAAFHHAHETYMVPDLLKSAYNNTPAVAIFATNGRYKREAWRGSEYAAKIHSENNITVIMKSDHPVLDSRFLLFEAQQAHHFGLPENLALAAVTTSPATVAGFGHRLGFIKSDYDADVVLWDSHPLSLGATPLQVWIDGIQQLEKPHPAKPLDVGVEAPPIASLPTHIISHEENDDGTEEGPDPEEIVDEVLFTNVSEVFVSRGGQVESLGGGSIEVLVRAGKIECTGSRCAQSAQKGVKTVDLRGGSILPPIIGYGPALGLTEIISEKTTTDNAVYDPLYSGELSTTQQIWGQRLAVQAIDGLEFDGKHLRTAHTAGVTKAVTAPMGNGFFRGVSVAFRTGAMNTLEEGAIIKEAVALHVTIGHYKGSQTPSISTEIAELRRLLLTGLERKAGKNNVYSPDYFALTAQGDLPLVINAWKADHFATLIRLKREIESSPKFQSGRSLNWVIHGGQEAHLVARDLAAANISVILSPPRAFPESWDERRAVAGPPLSPQNAPTILHNAGVRIGLGVPEEWQARTLMWEAAWAQKDSNGMISRRDAVEWVSSNLEAMLELPTSEQAEFVAYERDPFEFGSRAIAISSLERGSVRFF